MDERIRERLHTDDITARPSMHWRYTLSSRAAKKFQHQQAGERYRSPQQTVY
jgi:hypothetical protein